jgi:hypothetical protein
MAPYAANASGSFAPGLSAQRFEPEPAIDPGANWPVQQDRRGTRPVALYLALGVAAVMVALLVGYAGYLINHHNKTTAGGATGHGLADAEAAILRDTSAANLYQVACIYALTSKNHPEDKPRAFELLWKALRTGFGLGWVATDTDLDPVRSDPRFEKLVESARAYYEASKR